MYVCVCVFVSVCVCVCCVCVCVYEKMGMELQHLDVIGQPAFVVFPSGMHTRRWAAWIEPFAFREAALLFCVM